MPAKQLNTEDITPAAYKSIQSTLMNLKLILTALGIISFANMILIYTQSTQLLAYSLSLSIVLVLWFTLLKKQITIEFNALKFEQLKIAIPIIILTTITLILLFSMGLPLDLSSLLWMLIMAIVIAVYEELAFRAIMLKALLIGNLKPVVALYLSALIFSFFHIIAIGTLEGLALFLLLNTFMMGFFLAYIYIQTRNILLAIGIHFLWDFTTFINQALPIGKLSSVLTIVIFAMTLLYFTWSIKRVKLLNKHSF